MIIPNNPCSIPSGKLSHNYGKSSFSMGKSTISMVIFNSYVKLPEGNILQITNQSTKGFPEQIYIYIYVYVPQLPATNLASILIIKQSTRIFCSWPN